MDDRIILDDDVEVKLDEKIKTQELRKEESINYSNQNVNKYNFFDVIFSKKFMPLTFSIISIIFLTFMKFIAICGAHSAAFFAIFFFIGAGFSIAGLILNTIKYVKNKKIEFDVPTFINILSLIFLVVI